MVKKKPDATLKHFSYAPFAQRNINLYAATWDAAIERLANSMFNGEIKPSDLDRDLVLKNYAAFNKEAESGWGKGYYESASTRRIRENILKFSGAKSYNLMVQLSELSKKGLSKEDFTTKAKQLVLLHNETWLETEKKFTANSASSARDFESYQKDIDVYPNLKNRTMGDKSVRESHALNEGIIKPVNEWLQIPPYDPGCRCWLEQTNEPPTTGRNLQNLDNKWANNAVISGKIFVENHSYFQQIPSNETQAVYNNSELMKNFIPYNRTINIGDKKVFINDFADLSDMSQNIEAAKILAKELNKNIYIRPHINNVKGHKNPELGIGTANNIGDLKTYSQMKNGKVVKLESFLSSSLKGAQKQGASILVVDISDYLADEYETILKRRLTGGLNNINKRIKEVIVIKSDKASRITRKQITSHNFSDFIDGLK